MLNMFILGLVISCRMQHPLRYESSRFYRPLSALEKLYLNPADYDILMIERWTKQNWLAETSKAHTVSGIYWVLIHRFNTGGGMICSLLPFGKQVAFLMLQQLLKLLVTYPSPRMNHISQLQSNLADARTVFTSQTN